LFEDDLDGNDGEQTVHPATIIHISHPFLPPQIILFHSFSFPQLKTQCPHNQTEVPR